jgi:hypothetical protein
MNKAFDYNQLLSKAQLYVERAHEEERDGNLYPFWISLSLEFVIRSTLAKIHPSLLADTPNQNEFDSLLFAFGFKVTKEPKSIAISTAINRLGAIIPTFTKELKLKALSIIKERNIELHSGTRGFEDYPVEKWISDYYRICNILLNHQELELESLLGRSESKAALTMIEENDERLRKIILERIKAHKAVFENLEEDEVIQRKIASEKYYRGYSQHTIKTQCPSCSNEAQLNGQKISISGPKIVGDELKEETRYLPVGFLCQNCGLKMNNYQELKAAELGKIFTVIEYPDPIEYLGIDAEEYLRQQNEYMDE